MTSIDIKNDYWFFPRLHGSIYVVIIWSKKVCTQLQVNRIMEKYTEKKAAGDVGFTMMSTMQNHFCFQTEPLTRYDIKVKQLMSSMALISKIPAL